MGGPENDFVNGLFFKHIQFEGDPLPVKFSNQRDATWIRTIRIEVVFDEVEKRGSLRIADAFRARFVAFGEFVQKVQGTIGRDLINLEVFEMQTQLICNELVGPDGIFFSNGPGGNRSRFLLLWLGS